MIISKVKQKKRIFLKYSSKFLCIEHYNSQLTLLKFYWLLSGLLGIIYPSAGISLLGLGLMTYYLTKKEFFNDSLKNKAYERILAPKMSGAHFISVGYEVFEEELDKHLAILNNLDNPHTKEQAAKILARKENLIKTEQKYREVGLSKNQLTTHFWVIGTTGAGKTSFIMTLIKKAMEIGAGCIFVDGKADEKMFAKLYNLATSAGREKDVFLINFLGIEGQTKEHTNTFNPLAGAPPEQIIEFLMALQGEATGDQAYWQGRGKALLSPIVYFLCFREKYYNEKFTLTMLADFINDTNKFILLCGFTKAMCKLVELKLQEDKNIYPLFTKAQYTKGLTDEEFPNLDALTYYYTIRPSEKVELLMRGYDFDFLADLWKVYLQIINYTKALHKEVMDTVNRVSNFFAEAIKESGEDIKTLGWSKAIDIYKNFVEKEIDRTFKELEKMGMEGVTKEQLLKQLEFPSDAGDSLQQHGYAQQQWTSIFSVLTTYSHIFDTLEPEVDMLDILKNQKILYVLLPPLKQSASTTQLLGRLIITTLRFTIAKALGGYVENLTQEQKTILEKIITPQPLGLCIFDEYGSYPVEGIDTFLAQVRSINISVILSTQDYTSARVGGKDENSVKRAWANTQKLILRVKDNETLEMIEKSLKKEDYIQESYIEGEFGHYIKQSSFQIGGDQRSVFDVSKLLGFKNGLGLFITDDEPIITQIYWSDSKAASNFLLNHFVKME
ncbi:MAG: type IV secretion system DNA-binding domain-containing protein [Thermofilaceae archaeon]